MKIVLVLMATALLSACSANETGAPANGGAANTSDMAMTMPDGASHDGMAMPKNATPATRGYQQSMQAMMADAPPYTGDADVDFMQQMRVHHVAAVAMSEVQLQHGKDAEARALATRIIADQRAEIAQIDRWLAAQPK